MFRRGAIRQPGTRFRFGVPPNVLEICAVVIQCNTVSTKQQFVWCVSEKQFARSVRGTFIATTSEHTNRQGQLYYMTSVLHMLIILNGTLLRTMFHGNYLWTGKLDLTSTSKPGLANFCSFSRSTNVCIKYLWNVTSNFIPYRLWKVSDGRASTQTLHYYGTLYFIITSLEWLTFQFIFQSTVSSRHGQQSR